MATGIWDRQLGRSLQPAGCSISCLWAQLSFLSACWLAASARQREGTGWSQRTAALPEARVLREGGMRAVSLTTPCPSRSVQMQRAGNAERSPSPWLRTGSHQEPSVSLPLSQGRALQLAGCLQARAQGENQEEGRSGDNGP